MKTNSTIHDPRHMTVIDVLKKYRLDHGWTQDELAEKLGVNRVYISKTEIGERNLSFIELIDYCKALDVNIHGLIKTLTGEKLPENIYEDESFLIGYASGFLNGKGETNPNAIKARILKKEEK
ncbi:MAG: helix-turn-helix domain-containing protein [Arenicella sp.]